LRLKIILVFLQNFLCEFFISNLVLFFLLVTFLLFESVLGIAVAFDGGVPVWFGSFEYKFIE